MGIAENMALAERLPERRQWLIDRINAMPLGDQHALSLRFETGMNTNEIAAALGWLPREAQASLNRSMSILQDALEPPPPREPGAGVAPLHLNGKPVHAGAKRMPSAWLVVAADGFQAVFLLRTRAEQYAINCHGIVWPLYREHARAATA